MSKEKLFEFLKNNKKNIVKVLIIFILILILFFLIKLYYPHFKINRGNITLNYKDKYKEYGCSLIIKNKDYSKKVRISGKVNTKKLGKYKIKYTYKKGSIKLEKTRIVTVKDLSKPIIELEGGEESLICPNTKYQEEGFKAIDNYDGDITEKVRVEQNSNIIIYTAIDSFNNKSIKRRKIIEEDKTNPSIILKGDSVVNLVLGNNYQEPGYTANDNCSGDITDRVKVSGNVDTSRVGMYTITYTVEDDYNNKYETKRTIYVREEKIGVIYLTFDDGPNAGTTNVILDILKEEGVKATFFVTNNGPDELIKREYDEGHTVALHTATHQYSIYSSPETYFQDLDIVSNRVERITGHKSYIIRFPGGSSNTVSRKYNVGIMSYLTKEVLNRGYKYYDWNISSGDAGNTTESSEVYQNVINRLSKDSVNMVLMHDIKTYTRDALRSIIRYGKDNGYIFERITKDTEMVTQRVNN